MSLKQGELFSEAQHNPGTQTPEPQKAVSDPAPVWLQRASLGVFVIFCFYIGGLLALLPWWGSYWQQNGWMLSHPAVFHFLQQGWVRGLITGLGLLDIWIGVSEIIHYRDYRP